MRWIRYLWLFLPSLVEFAATLVYMVYGFPTWIMWAIHGAAWAWLAFLWLGAVRHRRQMEQLIALLEAYDRLTKPPQ